MSMDICGGDGIYIPPTECDDCDAFLFRLEQAEDNIEYLADHKQNNLVAGENITIIPGVDGDTISATGGGATYTAGTNISILGNEISAPNVYSKTEVNELISDLEGIRMEVVTTLPATGESNVIYLLDDGHGNYEQWVYTQSDGWIDLGGEEIDLTNYYTKAEIDAKVMTTAEMAAGTATVGKMVKAKDLADTYVNVTGDTMTGLLKLENSISPIYQARNPSISSLAGVDIPASGVNQFGGSVRYDKDNSRVFWSETNKDPSDRVYSSFVTARVGTAKRNGLFLGLAPNGDAEVWFSGTNNEPNAWKKALDVKDKTYEIIELQYSADNQTLAAGAAAEIALAPASTPDSAATVCGYRFLNITNASTGGTGCQYARMYYLTIAANKTSAAVRIMNTHSAAIKLKVIMTAIMIKVKTENQYT